MLTGVKIDVNNRMNLMIFGVTISLKAAQVWGTDVSADNKKVPRFDAWQHQWGHVGVSNISWKIPKKSQNN